MLFKSLEFLKEQLNQYMDSFPADEKFVTSPVVVLDDVSKVSAEELKKTDHIFMTLFHLTEETSLKNIPSYTRDGENTVYQNPPVFLNLYILFTACMVKYENALRYLSRVIMFFQGKKMFTAINSRTEIAGLEDLRITLDIYSAETEAASELRASQERLFPSIVYKARVVRLERESTMETRGMITEIRLDDNQSNITNI